MIGRWLRNVDIDMNLLAVIHHTGWGNIEPQETKSFYTYPCYHASKLWGKLAKPACLGVFGPSTRIKIFGPAGVERGFFGTSTLLPQWG